jgi:hypothetical protein
LEAEDAEAEDSGVRIGPVVSTASTVAGVLLAIAVLTLGKLLVFGLLAAALLPWVAVFLRPAWRPLKYVLASTLTVALTAFALTLISYQGHPAKITDTKAQPLPPLDRLASHLKFLSAAGPIPHCTSFEGTGSIPARHGLVLFDRATDSAGHYTPTSTFSYDGQAAPSSTGTGWTAPNRNIGSGDASGQDSHIAIVAVLMPQDTADFLDILTSSSDSGLLPPNVTSLGATADRLIVIRNAQNAHC